MLRTVAFVAALAAGTLPGVALANLLVNGDFDSGVEPWVDPFPDPGTTVSWSPIDSAGSPTSGSIQVETVITNGAADGPWSECIPAEPGPYTFSGQVFRPDSPALAWATLDLLFFPSPDCVGPYATATAFANEVDVWEHVTLTGFAPLGTAALRARVLVGGTSDTIPDVARFDRLVLTAPEPGAGSLAAAAALALAAAARVRRRAAAPPRWPWRAPRRAGSSS